MASKSWPSSWVPSRMGRIVLSSCRTVFGWWSSYLSSPLYVVLSCLCGVAQGLCLTGPRCLLSPRSLQGQCSILILIRADTLGNTRPLPIPSRGQDGGEVVHPSSVAWPSHEEGVMANPNLSVWSGSLGLPGPRSFGPLLADMLWAAWPSN
jgi:hypothetical protein